MEKKMIDILGQIDESFYIGTELSKEEEITLTQMLDFDRIKEKARMGRRDEAITKIAAGVENRRISIDVKPRKVLRRLLCAALVVMLFATAAVAQHLDAFREFLGIQAVIPEEEITDVGKSVSKDGVQMTIDSVIAGKNDFVTLFSFEFDNGKTFPENTHIYTVALNSDQKDFNVATYSTKLSDDRKQLMTCIESSSGKSMLGKTVTGKAIGVYTETTRDKNMDVSLCDCFRKSPVRIAFDVTEENASWIPPFDSEFEKQLAKQRENYTVKMPDNQKYPDISFAGVATVGGRICVVTYYPGFNKKDPLNHLRSFAVVNKLVDSRTGQIYSGSYSNDESSISKGKGIVVAEFSELHEYDLPYVTPVATYVEREVLAEGPWEISFLVKDQGKNITVNPDMSVNTKKGTILLTEANISLVGGYIIGQWTDPESAGGLPEGYQTGFKAVTEDGETLKFRASGGSSFRDEQGKDCFKFNYILCQDDKFEKRVFLSREELKSIERITLDGKVIPVD